MPPTFVATDLIAAYEGFQLGEYYIQLSGQVEYDYDRSEDGPETELTGASIQLPEGMTFLPDRADFSAETNGRTLTFSFSEHQVYGAGADRLGTGFSRMIPVSIPTIEELPATPPAWGMDLTMTTTGPAGGFYQSDERGFYLYSRPEVILLDPPAELVPGATLTYQVTTPVYPHGTVVVDDIGIAFGPACKLVPGTLDGLGEECNTFGNDFLGEAVAFCRRWEGGYGSHSFTFQVQVQPAWWLDVFDVTSFDVKIGHHLVVETEPGHQRSVESFGNAASIPREPDDDDEKLIVNSTGDRPRAVDAEGCETGFMNSAGDPECTLRSAIQALNSGLDGPITFDIPGDEVPVILIQSALPAIARPVLIDGSTQEAGQVLVRGNMLGGVGFDVQGGDSELKKLVIQGFTGANGGCIKLSGEGGNKVTDCKLGTDITGTLAENQVKNGITIDGCDDNEIANCVISTQYYGLLAKGMGADRNHIHGNRIGLSTTGELLPVQDGLILLMGNENRVEDNLIAGARAGIFCIAERAGSGLTLRGNRVGLYGDGTQATSPGTTIVVVGVAGFANVTIADNVVAGGGLGMVIGSNISGVSIAGNRIGLTDSGEVPSGLPAGHAIHGLRLDGASNVTVSNNTIAGYTWGSLVSGAPQFSLSPGVDEDGDGEPDSGGEFTFGDPDNVIFPQGSADGVVMENNRIGLNQFSQKPSGVDQKVGVAVYGGAQGVVLRNNSIAAHSIWQLRLDNGSGHKVSGNSIGTLTGDDLGSANGIMLKDANDVVIGSADGVPGNMISGHTNGSGIWIQGGASGAKVIGNFIGTNRGATLAWPNRTGINVLGGLTGSPSGLVIEDNVIAGNSDRGVVLNNFPETVTFTGNSIGVSHSGLPLPNETGVYLIGAISADMMRNTIAYNTLEGIQVSDTTATLNIRQSPIYQNGDDLREAGIRYNTEPFAPPEMRVLRTTDPVTGKVLVVLAVAPMPFGAEFDFFVNPSESETQGRTFLFGRAAGPGQPFVETITTEPGTRLASQSTFTLTATVGGRTSSFSTHAVADSFVYPELNFASSSSASQITLTWPKPEPMDLFVIEQTNPAGIWFLSESPVINLGDSMFSSFQIEGEEQLFRLAINPLVVAP